MESTEVKAAFAGFGPIPQSKPTHIGGFGREGSFAPSKQNKIRLRSDRNLYNPIGVAEEAPSQPFDINLEGRGDPDPNTGEFSSYTATIGAGTVNGILPSNMFEEFVVSNGVTYYFKVVATTDGRQVTAASIVVDGSLPTAQVPVPQALPAGFQMLFGIYMGGEVYRTAGIGNLSAPSQALFTADRVNQVIGRPITETWYNWRV